MKRKISILLTNILLIIIILLLFEIFIFWKDVDYTYEDNQDYRKKTGIEKFEFIINKARFFYFPEGWNSRKEEEAFFKYFRLENFRPPIIKETENNKNIVLMGCSFTYGNELDDFSNLSGQLAQYTDANIYNLGLSGGSQREILYILRNKKLYKKLIETNSNIDSFIYVIIDDHKHRICLNERAVVPFFLKLKKKKEETLKYINIPSFLNASCFVRYFANKIFRESFFIEQENLFILYLKEIKKEIQKINPNAKFIVLIYDEIPTDENKISKISDKMIYAQDLVDVDLSALEYKNEDECHPNAKAWQKIAPSLAKELDL